MPLWAKIDAGFHRNPKVRRAGRDGREVYLWLLLTNRAHDFDGSIPAGYSDPKYIARELEMRPGLVVAALSRCVEAGLIVMTAESVVTLCGWDGDWRTPADDSRERVRRHRANQRKIIEGCNGAVTVGNGVTAPRVEESREEKINHSSPIGAGVLVSVDPIPRFDLEAIYSRYPRKVGKTNGMKRLRASVKSQADYEELGRALTAYLAHVAGKDKQYIRQFDTWCTTWRDWLEPDCGDTAAAQPQLSDFDQRLLAAERKRMGAP